MSRTERLAEAILKDRQERKQSEAQTGDATCFGCGKPYIYRGPREDNSGRFCSDECRIEYDTPRAFTFDPFKHTKWRVLAGGETGYLVTTPMTRVSAREREDGISRGGWRIDCAGCGKRFESFGLRHCKPGCARVGRERLEARALMAEAG